MKNYKPLLANIASQTIFGFTFLFMKMGLAVVDQDSVKFLAFRFGLAFIVMSALVLLKVKKVNFSTGSIWLIVICGLVNPCISQVLETSSVSFAPSSQIALYESMIPIVMLLFSSVINKEYPTRRQMIFVCLCVAGVFISNLVPGDVSGMTTVGMMLIIGTIVTVSIGRVLVRRASEFFGSYEITYVTTAMGAVLFNVLSIGNSAASGNISHYLDGLFCPEFGLAVLYMAVGSCICAFLLSTYASANLPFAVYSSTCTISTAVAILAGVLLLHEPFTARQLIGTIIILAGVIGISFSYDNTDSAGNRYHAK